MADNVFMEKEPDRGNFTYHHIENIVNNNTSQFGEKLQTVSLYGGAICDTDGKQ